MLVSPSSIPRGESSCRQGMLAGQGMVVGQGMLVGQGMAWQIQGQADARQSRVCTPESQP